MSENGGGDVGSPSGAWEAKGEGEEGGEGRSSAEGSPATLAHRRESVVRELVQLERAWRELRELLREERLSVVDRLAAEVREGNGAELQKRLQRLQEEAEERVSGEKELRRMQREEAGLVSSAALEAAETNLARGRDANKEHFRDTIRQRRDQLHASRRESQVSLALFEWTRQEKERSSALAASQARRRRRRRVVVESGPYVVHQLSEEAIADDVRALRHAAIRADLLRDHQPPTAVA